MARRKKGVEARDMRPQSAVDIDAARFKTENGRESGIHTNYWHESGRLVGGHVSWRQYVALWRVGHLSFLCDKNGLPKKGFVFDPDAPAPSHLPSYRVAHKLAYIERVGSDWGYDREPQP